MQDERICLVLRDWKTIFQKEKEIFENWIWKSFSVKNIRVKTKKKNTRKKVTNT